LARVGNLRRINRHLGLYLVRTLFLRTHAECHQNVTNLLRLIAADRWRLLHSSLIRKTIPQARKLIVTLRSLQLQKPPSEIEPSLSLKRRELGQTTALLVGVKCRLKDMRNYQRIPSLGSSGSRRLSHFYVLYKEGNVLERFFRWLPSPSLPL
jgi:hypothetical protein